MEALEREKDKCRKALSKEKGEFTDTVRIIVYPMVLPPPQAEILHVAVIQYSIILFRNHPGTPLALPHSHTPTEVRSQKGQS